MTEAGLPKILIVDDIPANLVVVRRLLAGMDVEIIEAHEGRQALEKTLEHEFALVLLDVQMPLMSGYEVAESMRSLQATKYTPIIFITANYTEEVNIIRGYEVGAVDYIQKPLDKHILQSKVRIFAELYKKQQEIERLTQAQAEYIEQLKQAQIKMEEVSKAKSIFLANMSHEIRTPLNGIMGMTELLLRSGLDEKKLEYANAIYSSSDVLLALVSDVLDFSKIEAGEMGLSAVPVNVDTIAKEVIQTQLLRAAENNIEIVLDCDSGLPVIMADPVRLRQILVNLVSNAVKFAKDSYVLVNIINQKEQKEVIRLRFEVVDGGIGIAKDRHANIFEYFTQADSSTTKKYAGTGLGLAICKKLVNMMGGNIGVVSELGQGATFWFEITFSKALKVPVPKRLVPVQAIIQKKILVVDDLEINCRVLTAILEGWGITCDATSSGNQALKMMQQAAAKGAPYDIALVDYIMPEMNGKELANAIFSDEKLKAIKLIMITGAHKIGNVKHAHDVGFSACLLKPIYPSELLQALLETLQQDGADSGHVISEKDTKIVSGLEKIFDNLPVLLVEDSRINQAFAEELLQELGCNVDIAENGKVAVTMAAKGCYKAIFMDCMMPEMDGYEATRAIRKYEETTGQHVPIIAMTANALEGDREKCLAAGMDDYITKPIKTKILASALKAWVGKEKQSNTPV